MIVTGRRREEGRKDEEEGEEERGRQGRTLGDANTVPTENGDAVMYCKISCLLRFQLLW